MGTLLRRRVATLRWSILAAAGIVPMACSGSVTRNGDDTAGSNQGGTRSTTKPKPPSGVGGSGPISMGGGAMMGTAGNLPFPPCTSPEAEHWSGLVTCQEGYEHRPEPVVCDVAVGGAPGEAGGAGGDGGVLPRADGTVVCDDDASNCRQFELGYCQDSSGGGGVAVCHSGCTTDEDCGTGAFCVCDRLSTRGGVCHPSDDCKSDQDCEPGYRCASYDISCGTTPFACQKPADECVGNDCQDFGSCVATAEGRVCEDLPACGRPFLVESNARVAPVVAGSSWHAGGSALPAVDHLGDVERAELAEHWTKMGQLEHASIAAFARFSLQLLSLGAPPELVDECTRALADETAHAKLCFGIASAYAGCAIGPGALDITGSLHVTTLTDIVDLVIAEGCFGETNAALEALQAAESASDPVIVAAYTRIARDEERHAALAFRFLRWALEREPHAVRPRILIARPSPPLEHAFSRDVVLPCLDALLATTHLPSTQELFT